MQEQCPRTNSESKHRTATHFGHAFFEVQGLRTASCFRGNSSSDVAMYAANSAEKSLVHVSDKRRCLLRHRFILWHSYDRLAK